MELEEILMDLHELVKMQETKINGLSLAVDILKNKQKKTVRELEYLRSQYDSKVERDVVNNAINLVKRVNE